MAGAVQGHPGLTPAPARGGVVHLAANIPGLPSVRNRRRIRNSPRGCFPSGWSGRLLSAREAAAMAAGQTVSGSGRRPGRRLAEKPSAQPATELTRPASASPRAGALAAGADTRRPPQSRPPSPSCRSPSGDRPCPAAPGAKPRPAPTATLCAPSQNLAACNIPATASPPGPRARLTPGAAWGNRARHPGNGVSLRAPGPGNLPLSVSRS